METEHEQASIPEILNREDVLLVARMAEQSEQYDDMIAILKPYVIAKEDDLDFEFQMSHSDIKKDFNENLLHYTDNMHVRGKPLFKTEVPGEKLQAAVKDFWLEINSEEYTSKTQSINLGSTPYDH